MKPNIRNLALGLLTLSTTSLYAQEPASASAPAVAAPTTQQTLATTEVKLRLLTPAWRYIGGQKAQDVAKKFTFIFGAMDPKPFHEGNPEAKCIRYMLGPYVGPNTLSSLVGSKNVETIDTQCLAKDEKGNTIKARGFENWLVVPDNPKWLEMVTGDAKRLLDGTGFDGIFSDSMGTAPVEGKYLLANPVNPATGKLYTKEEWIAAECKMLDAITKALPKDKLHILNGLGPGERYWTEPEATSPRPLLQYVDGAMSESIWRHATASLEDWPSLELWNKDINMIKDVEKRGKIGFWWTKVWTGTQFTSTTQPNADKLIPQWLRFSLGSYLLAAGPHSYYNFDTARTDNPKGEGQLVSNAAEQFPEYDAPLGTATGEMQAIGDTGAYWRPFSNGAVIVNPTEKTIEKIELPDSALKNKEFISWGAQTPFTFPADVEAHTGLILTYK